MFYDRFVYLCAQKGVSPSRAALDAGISKSLVTKWKNNHVQDPSAEVLRKLSAYFGMSVAELLGEQAQAPQVTDAQLKFALWGDCADISDDDLADVRRYAAFVRERKRENQ